MDYSRRPASSEAPLDEADLGMCVADEAYAGNGAAAEDTSWSDVADTGDFFGKVADAVGVMDDFGGWTDRIAGVGSLPGDMQDFGEGIARAREGHPEGVVDAAEGGVGVVGDVATIAGVDPIADGAGVVKGGMQIGEGMSQIDEVMNAPDVMAPGTSAPDEYATGVDGVENILNGTADVASSSGNEWGEAAGKGLAVGMAIGEELGPYVYGEQPTGAQTQTIPEDGIWKPTTGNGVVDWLFGI